MSVEFANRPPRTARVVCEIMIDASREPVWRAWFDRTADWFYEKEPGQHDGASHCEEKMGGKFYMDVPGGGFNVLGEVTMIKPGKKIRLRGDCTIPDAFIANMTIAFEDVGEGGTKVMVDHRMSGDFDDDLPAGFEEGWTDGLTKLKALVEGAARE